MFENFEGKRSETNGHFLYIKTSRVQNFKNQNIEQFIFLKRENGFCEENQKGGINRGFHCGVVALAKVCHKRRVVVSSQSMVLSILLVSFSPFFF